MKTRIEIKPLSINQAFQGKRFKTDKYKTFERSMLYLLPQMEVPKGELIIWFTFGFSNMRSDLDNPVKMTTDILCKKYGFDDSRVKRLIVDKEKTEKGKEFVEFQILAYR
jgi:Holliday junction resolvase RusA-like endonuclease